MDDDKTSRIRARLAEPREQVARHATADDYVRSLYADVAGSRQAGKTWKEIAEDFRPDVQLSADSLRQAYERLKKGKGKHRRPTKPRRAARSVDAAPANAVAVVPASASTPERPKVDLGVFAVTRDSVADLEGSLL